VWSRRRFLETVAALPVVGGVVASTVPAAAAAGRSGGRDYFRELGVRPFINAAGTYTAMTASLMPPEVMEAINYASKHYVMLDELHDLGGEAIAKLVRAEEIRKSASAVPGVKAEVFVPEVANHVPHVRVTWESASAGPKAAAVVRAMQDGEPSIAIRSEGESLVVGVWMMQPGEEKVVARRLRQELEKKA
jgi:hypothetical protein